MPQHNTKGKSKKATQRYARQSQTPAQHKFYSTRKRVRNIVTNIFYANHIALTSNPNFNSKLGDTCRAIDNSSCIILTPAEIGKLESLVKLRRQSGVTSSVANANRSIIYRSEKEFKMMVWGGNGQGKTINGTFSYVMLRRSAATPWYIHHLEDTHPVIAQKGESDSDDEIYFTDDESDFDEA